MKLKIKEDFIAKEKQFNATKHEYVESEESKNSLINELQKQVKELNDSQISEHLCQFDASRYWNGKLCIKKRHLNENCSEYEECDSNENLECFNNTCLCLANTHSENLSTKKCG